MSGLRFSLSSLWSCSVGPLLRRHAGSEGFGTWGTPGGCAARLARGGALSCSAGLVVALCFWGRRDASSFGCSGLFLFKGVLPPHAPNFSLTACFAQRYIACIPTSSSCKALPTHVAQPKSHSAAPKHCPPVPGTKPSSPNAPYCPSLYFLRARCSSATAQPVEV